LQQVARSMTDLQIVVRAGNNQNAANAGEIAIIKFRLDKMEEDHARIMNGKRH
jgi:hypothetical protein